jgi:hypothetical protein
MPRNVTDPLAQLLGQTALIEKNFQPVPLKLDGWSTKIKTLEVVDR